ncbi:MAG: histidine--tRNA ligase [Patescibacteria group bacterium]|jgi:histidyl-tRNA synthetase|nr:histidine--tRNA ligase [Patescibacteria group bacterium]
MNNQKSKTKKTKNTNNSSSSNKAVKKSHKRPGRVMGVKDYAGFEGESFSLLKEKINQFANYYSLKNIEVPIIESYDLYKKSKRVENDKELYFVEGEKGEKLVLRPEITQGVIRSLLENNLFENSNSHRLFSLGKVFRKEKLKSGHYREFTQANFEIIGDRKPITEALFLAAVSELYKDLGINIQIQINCLGDHTCRKEYSSKLSAFFKERGKKSKMCTCCKNVLAKNPIALLDCTEESCQSIREEAPQILDSLSPDSREYFTKTLEYLDEMNVNYNLSPYLVRGFSYYTDTVYEFWSVNEDGEINGKNSLAAGGRYDNYIESFDGEEVPAFGLAIGLERTLARIKDKSLLNFKKEDDIIFIAQLGDQARIKCLKLFKNLQAEGFKVRQSLTSDSLKIQLEEAAKMKAKTSLILGKKEIMDGTVLLRDMDSGAQETVIFKKVKERLIKMNKITEKKVNIRKEAGIYG